MSALEHVLHDNQKHALAAGLPAKGLKLSCAGVRRRLEVLAAGLPAKGLKQLLVRQERENESLAAGLPAKGLKLIYFVYSVCLE